MNPEKQQSDQVLLRQSVGGDEAAIATLIERHRKKVMNYILTMVKDRQTADDLFQETFIKVIGSLRAGRYAENGKFVPWLLRIAHNQVIDSFRGEKKPTRITCDVAGYDILNNSRLSDPNIEDKMILDQVGRDIRNLIRQLPVEQRMVVVLRHYMNLGFREISEQTGVSINTALGRMRYALINLRKMIDEKRVSFSG